MSWWSDREPFDEQDPPYCRGCTRYEDDNYCRQCQKWHEEEEEEEWEE